MKSLTLVAACIFILSSVGCIRTEEELVIQSCVGFDFGIPERDWILLLPGIDYSFSSGEKTLKFTGKYIISEPYTYGYDRNSVTESQVNNCNGYYQSTHISEDRSLIIYNAIGYNKSMGIGYMNVGFRRMGMELEILNDTLTGRRTNPTQEDPYDYLFERISFLTLGEKQFNQVVRISQSNPNPQTDEIYLAKREGLVAFVTNDSLWVRD